MRRTLTVVGGCVAGLALCCVSLAQGTPADSLWQKAVELMDTNDDLVPGTMKTFMQEVDKHGEAKDENKYRESWGRLYLREDGEIEYEPLKIIEDGEDVTEEEIAKEEERKEEDDEDSESDSMEGYSPFDMDSQDRMSAKRSGEGEIIDGKSTVEFEFTEETEEDEEYSGKVWLEAGTGVPVKVEYTVDPLPKRVKRMVTTMAYEFFAPDSIVVGGMSVDATGGILFIKKHFHMEMTFDNYWRLPEGYEERMTEE